MKKGDKVKWVDGMGFEHRGIVARDLDRTEFMIPVEQKDRTVLRIPYSRLRLDR